MIVDACPIPIHKDCLISRLAPPKKKAPLNSGFTRLLAKLKGTQHTIWFVLYRKQLHETEECGIAANAVPAMWLWPASAAGMAAATRCVSTVYNSSSFDTGTRGTAGPTHAKGVAAELNLLVPCVLLGHVTLPCCQTRCSSVSSNISCSTVSYGILLHISDDYF